MSGTIEGGRKAAKSNLERHGKNFYANIGRKGGKAGTTGGFYVTSKEDCDCGGHINRAACAGARGGSISRRRKKVVNG